MYDVATLNELADEELRLATIFHVREVEIKGSGSASHYDRITAVNLFVRLKPMFDIAREREDYDTSVAALARLFCWNSCRLLSHSGLYSCDGTCIWLISQPPDLPRCHLASIDFPQLSLRLSSHSSTSGVPGLHLLLRSDSILSSTMGG